MLLAIDTSTELTGLACYDQRGLLGECTWLSGRNHTVQLLPQLQMLMRHLRYNTNDIRAVAVALGPGSWSGLRVGMSVAKGMALAGKLALIGVGTLDVLAYQHQERSLPVCPLIRLGRGRFATATFHSAGTWQRLSEYTSIVLDDLHAQIHEETLFCGDIDADVQTRLQRAVGTYAVFPQPAANMRRPGYLAELAWQRFVAGERASLTHLEPLYLGEPVKATA